MKRFLLALTMALFIVSSGFAKTAYRILYSAEQNVQTKVYTNKLHEVNIVILRDGDDSMVIDSKYFKLSNKVVTDNELYHAVQYDATDLSGRTFVVSFRQNKGVDPAMEHQVIFFSTSDIYTWTYYISEKPIEVN
ncbi:MAG: hypothetical protein VZR36_07795 [Prevotella sp.]|nr:hypothetical protein [Prevotella sp.]